MASSRSGFLVCVASFFLFGGLLSPINSYGRMFTDIQTDLNTTAVESGWVGSIAWATNFLVSPLAVVLEGYIGYRLTSVLGAVLCSACYLISSLIPNYLGVLFFLGFLNGSSSGLCIHATFCVLFMHFSSSAQTRSSGVAATGASVATILVTICYEMMVPLYGWRFTLRVTSVFAAVFGIPSSIFIAPKDEKNTGKSGSVGLGENGLVWKKHRTLHEQEEDPKEIEKVTSNDTSDDVTNQPTSEQDGCLHLLKTWRVWLIFTALMLPAMSWSVFWVNIISYFQSISIAEGDILLYVTIMTVSDLCGKITIVFFQSKIPVTEVNLLVCCNFVMAVVAAVFVLFPVKAVLCVCSVFIGIGRGWYNILPYKTAVELLDSVNTDRGITLAMVSLGIGFTIGTLPAGAIYDSTESYTLAFILNALLNTIGGLKIILLQWLARIRRRNLKGRDGHLQVRFQEIKETVV